VSDLSRQASRPKPRRKRRCLRPLGAGVALAQAVCGAASAATHPPRQVELPGQDLGAELSQLAQQTGIELLVDKNVVVHRRGPAVHGLLSPERALALVLAGSGLTFRQTPQGAFVVLATAPPAAPATLAVKEPPEVGAVAEILVTGRRSLNVDIPRSVNDIQPYQVATSDVIAASQSQTAEQFLRDRVPDDSASPASIQEPGVANGNPTSQVDLRGLGIGQTLVLLDGRRLAATSAQPDINAIPPSAIERIETLTSTAGGIYGPDAIGGVVNIVLKRDYQGSMLSLSSGETTRGDAPQYRVDGAFGSANSTTGTQVMLSLSHSETGGLDYGDRGFVEEAHVRATSLTPFSFIPPVAGQVNIASVSEFFPGLINIVSAGKTPLTLIPSLGGASLGSGKTHLPLSVVLSGASGEAALLQANAGAYDLSLSPDGQGTQQTLLTPTVTNALMFSARQQIGSRLEAFVDVNYFDDRGTVTGPSLFSSDIVLPAGAKGNPFQNTVLVSFPTPGQSTRTGTDDVTERATLGFIARLTEGWTGELDFTLGEASETDQTTENQSITITPFAGPADFTAALAAYRPVYSVQKLDDRLEDLNLRFAGPLFQLPGGPLTMTLLGEVRSDHPPLTPSVDIDILSADVTQAVDSAARVQVASAYAEARAPLVAMDSPLAPLRGLELQLAVREDSTAISIGHASSANFFNGSSTAKTTDRVVDPTTTTSSVTVGARVFPIKDLMLRASFATGYLPIAANPATSSTTYAATPFGVGLSDPKRGGSPVGSEGPVTLEDLGDPDPKPEFSQTASGGFVLTPGWLPGLRVSVDYNRTATSLGRTTALAVIQQYLIDNEGAYPGRIVRAPLTAADAAKGDSAGAVTTLNYSALNIARSTAESVHIRLDYSRGTPLGGFHFYGEATSEPILSFLNDPTRPAYNLAGYSDGPLKWRGNLGVDWSYDRWSAGLNAQIYGAYSESLGSPFSVSEVPDNLRIQGGNEIPAQAYLDAVIAYRSTLRFIGLGSRTIEYRLGLENVLDQTPPLVSAPGSPFQTTGYSSYGDPRGRRFEFTATTRF
jgi:iron complex outermembrane recepter protein